MKRWPPGTTGRRLRSPAIRRAHGWEPTPRPAGAGPASFPRDPPTTRPQRRAATEPLYATFADGLWFHDAIARAAGPGKL